MKIQTKKGVYFRFIDDRFITLAHIFWEEYQKEDIIPTITSADDGKHHPNSWHYKGLGWDWRVWNLRNPQNVADNIRKKAQEIDFHYNIIFGDELHKDHIHSEYNEKKVK